MKERGMVFTGPSIPLLLSGAKTQTRRVMRPQPYCPGGKFEPIIDGKWLWIPKYENDEDSHNIKPPKHRPGDLIWVREAWRTFRNYDHLKSSELLCTISGPIEQYIHYLADPVSVISERGITVSGRYRNARFMPKAFARIWLKVLDARPERLMDITPEDAFAEGVSGHKSFPVREFRATWDRIHKPPNAWADNRWVWAYTLDQTEQPS